MLLIDDPFQIAVAAKNAHGNMASDGSNIMMYDANRSGVDRGFPDETINIL